MTQRRWSEGSTARRAESEMPREAFQRLSDSSFWSGGSELCAGQICYRNKWEWKWETGHTKLKRHCLLIKGASGAKGNISGNANSTSPKEET